MPLPGACPGTHAKVKYKTHNKLTGYSIFTYTGTQRSLSWSTVRCHLTRTNILLCHTNPVEWYWQPSAWSRAFLHEFNLLGRKHKWKSSARDSGKLRLPRIRFGTDCSFPLILTITVTAFPFSTKWLYPPPCRLWPGWYPQNKTAGVFFQYTLNWVASFCRSSLWTELLISTANEAGFTQNNKQLWLYWDAKAYKELQGGGDAAGYDGRPVQGSQEDMSKATPQGSCWSEMFCS